MRHKPHQQRITSTGTPAVGIGAGLEFEVKIVSNKRKPRQKRHAFARVMDDLRKWHFEGHEDHYVLYRSHVADLINGVDALVEDARRVIAEERERCAKIAETETLTGVPPLDWPLDKIEACEATVRVTATSIAAAIRRVEQP